MLFIVYFCSFFFFKHKTAYEMRISDWSSDVCSSDLIDRLDADMRDYAVSSAYALLIGDDRRKALAAYFTPPVLASATLDAIAQFLEEIGRASCRERVCQDV